MTDMETGNSMLADSLLTDKQQCSHEFDMNDENDQLSVIDAVSVQTELEQLFNEFTNYNHHIQVFKKLLNLKELKNQYNFFAFNRRNQAPQPPNATDKSAAICCNGTHQSTSVPCQFNSFSCHSTATKLFKGGELSAMQVHSQLENIKEQFIESQLLVTCLVHNLQRLRKHYCGTALDVVSSSELLASLEKDHRSLKTCKSIFKYQCSEKRKQLTKLKQQLRQAHEDWNQLIVKRPTITKLSDEEQRLLQKSKEREKKRRKSVQSVQNQLASNLDGQLSGQLRQAGEAISGGELSNEVNGEMSGEVNGEINSEINSDTNAIQSTNDDETDSSNPSNSKADGESTDGNLSTSSDSNDPVAEKEKDIGSSSQDTDSAVHSESEADSLQELAEAIYRRKSKLDRLERECYSFMSRLANRNRTTDDAEGRSEQANLVDERANEQYDNSNLILDDYANDDYEEEEEDEDDEDLLDDEEYDDVEFDEEPAFDAFVSGEMVIESLINRYSMDLQADDESTERATDPQDGTISGELQAIANGDERLINDEIRRSVDYLIGQSRSIVNSTADGDLDAQMNGYLNEHGTSPSIDRLVEQEVMNRVNQADREPGGSSHNLSAVDQAEAPALEAQPSEPISRLTQSDESLALPAESDDLDAPLVPRSSGEDATQLAETGEPIGLCRLRRRAVKVLASRIRSEQEYYLAREKELRKKLDHLAMKNEELQSQLSVQQPHSKQLFLFSTAFVFCSLISYFMQTLN